MKGEYIAKSSPGTSTYLLREELPTQRLYGHSPLPKVSIRLINFTLGDVGGQKTLRTYWRNYFEKTDALIWVVDATDRLRITDCRKELGSLLLEEVKSFVAQPT